MIVRFESDALEEYRKAALFAEERFGAGEKFVRAVEAALDRISAAPDTFQPVGDNIRIFRLKRYPYYLFYHYSEIAESVTVYAVAHHKKSPDYWRGRL